MLQHIVPMITTAGVRVHEIPADVILRLTRYLLRVQVFPDGNLVWEQGAARIVCDTAARRLGTTDPDHPAQDEVDDVEWFTEHVRGCEYCNRRMLAMQAIVGDCSAPAALATETGRGEVADCAWVVARAGLYLDHTLAGQDREQFIEHVRGCASCFNRVTMMEQALQLIASGEVEDPDELVSTAEQPADAWPAEVNVLRVR